uniref:Uncharacterized protein n=1 Tax=Panagrolaimus sp. JU765 TaxID=591449 RepID=A0AC34RFG9_9BILA
MTQPKSKYSTYDIVQFQMFACGDVEYPIDECVHFVDSTVISHMKNTVQNCLKSMKNRNADKPEVYDLLIWYKNNPKLLKRMYDYFVLLNTNYSKLYANTEENDESDDDVETMTEDANISNSLANNIISAVEKFEDGEKMKKFLLDPEFVDQTKCMRNQRIAERAKSMSTEKYKRFSLARSYSFVRSKGNFSQEYLQGFRSSIDAPESFDRDLLNLLNFCALEMLYVLIERADKIRRAELGNMATNTKFGAIQLEHYQAAAAPVGKKSSVTSPPAKKRRKQ